MTRKPMWTLALLACALLLVAPHGTSQDAGTAKREADAAAKKPGRVIELEQCLVSLAVDVDVPAREAGVLDKLEVHEGQSVDETTLVALIDSSRALGQQRVAARQFELAQFQAKNDVNTRFSRAAAEVSAAEHQEAVAANRLSSGAVAETEVRRLQLTVKRSQLATEQAGFDQQVANLTEKMRLAELQLAKDDVQRRRITAPVRGTVVEVFKQPGEWVQAGETVLRIVKLDTLRIEGFVNVARLGDAELVDRPVEVTIRRQNEQTAKFSGQIVLVNPLIEARGNYRVRAEVKNREQNGRWLLRPGMEAKMTVVLGGRD